MKLEEAIERCNELIKEKHANWIGLTSQEAIETILQEIDRLQKENEELKNIDLTTVHIKGVCDEKERWRNKIRKMIETLEEQEKAELEPKDVLVFPKDTAYLSAKVEYYHKKNILQDLLKEE